MDFANERYVRLYTRDTMTWKRLGWDGQTMLMHLLRKVDRSGVIDIGDAEPWESGVMLCGAPEDQSRRGVTRMLDLGVIVHDGDRLVFPRFIEGNETPQSDAQRVREHREREKLKRAALKRNVTSSGNETLQIDNATKRVDTPSNSVPCRTEPSEPEELRSPPSAREGPSDFSIGSDLLQSATGRFYGDEWRSQLSRIGAKPEAERKAVLAAIRGDPWCKGNLSVDPAHVLKQWPKYAAGNPPLKQVVRAAVGGRYAGPSEVAKPEEYAVKGEIKW
jgi:hypothetical protein